MPGHCVDAVTSLVVVNPDATIAAINFDRAAEGGRLDAPYLTRLSADAVPAIISRFESIPTRSGAQGTALVERWTEVEGLRS
jgi:hypothetical protein